MNLCLICLRTDRLLKLASNALEEFYDEICDFTVVTLTSSYYYCSECEFLLTKFYKFKEKCVEALKIYHKWISAKGSNKQPMNLLYTLLPPSPLRNWAPNLDKVANYTFKSEDLETDSCVEEDLIKDTYSKHVKVEYDQIDGDNDTLTDIPKTEDISANVSGTEPMEIEIKNYTKTEGQLLFQNLDELLKNDSDETSNLKVSNYDTEVTDKRKLLKPKKPPNKKNTTKKKENTIINSLNPTKLCTKTIDKNQENGIENLPKPKKLSKKMLAKQKAYFDKAKENDQKFESVFEIEYLTTQEMKLEEFERRKTYECYINAEHKCEICYQVFKNLKCLEHHTKKWHNESPDSMFCPLCKIWTSKTSNHRVTHTVVFKCKMCPLVTYHRESMHNHFEQHKGKQYHCEECNITCKSKSAYRSHMGKVHRRGKNVCSGCGRGFRSPSGLAIHRSCSSRCTAAKEAGAPDTGTGGVRCDDCDVTLPSQEVFEAHVWDVHAGSGRPFLTDSAGLPEHRTFVRKSRKVKCIRSGPAKQTCRVCNAVGMGFYWLRMHFKREHPNEDINVLYADKRPHLCDICGTGFSSVYPLRDHMNIHTGARPYSCDLCPKRFRSVCLMRAHRVRHLPAALTCTHCGKQFKTKGNLYWHMKVHTSEKNHKCDICGKEFLYGANLTEHVRGVHYNIRRVKRGGAREGADSAAGRGAKRRKTAAEGETDSDCGDSRQ